MEYEYEGMKLDNEVITESIEDYVKASHKTILSSCSFFPLRLGVVTAACYMALNVKVSDLQ